MDKPFKKLANTEKDIIFYGNKEPLQFEYTCKMAAKDMLQIIMKVL